MTRRRWTSCGRRADLPGSSAPQPQSAAGQVDAALADALGSGCWPLAGKRIAHRPARAGRNPCHRRIRRQPARADHGPALGGRRLLALDPGWRTGAKLVCPGCAGRTAASRGHLHPLTGDAGAERAASTPSPMPRWCVSRRPLSGRNWSGCLLPVRRYPQLYVPAFWRI